MRERLAEIYHKAEIEYLDYLTSIAERAINDDIEDKIQKRQDFYVDKLIANGVIVPPCKVGDTVYVIKRCRCGKPENYDLQVCGRKITTKTPKVLARVMYQETGKRLKPNYTGKIEYEVVPKGTICYSIYEKQFTLKMLTKIGKTVFLTKEEAEAALKGGEG